MKKYLVIGNPINHSLSPKLHNYWLEQNNINAVYDKMKLEENEIETIIKDIKKQKIAGCNVTGIAGSNEKCKYLKETLNFDNVINYQKENVFKKIKEFYPEGVNVYFDNVGGKVADDVISNIAPFGRIGVCGVISQYNLTEMETGMRVQRAVLTVRGDSFKNT